MRQRLVLLGVFALGCSEGRELPPLRASTERVEYYSDRELSCAEAPRVVERHLEALEEAWGIEGPDRVRFVHLVDWEGWGHNPCQEKDGGCTDRGDVFSRAPVNRHELVHSFLIQRFGRSVTFLEEGFATAFGYNRVASHLYADWRSLLAPELGTAEYASSYVVGARFVTFLHQIRGIDRLLELYEVARWDTTAEELAARFEELYGAPLDEAWRAAQETILSPYVCAGLEDTVDLEGGENHLSCSDDPRVAPFVFTLDEESSLALASSYRNLELRPCDPTSSASASLSIEEGESVTFLWRLPPAQYFLSSYGELSGETSGDEPSVGEPSAGELSGDRPSESASLASEPSLRVRRGTFIGATCEELGEPFTVPDDPSNLRIMLRWPEDRRVALRAEEELTFDSWKNSSATWWLCESCADEPCPACEDSGCVRATTTEPLRLGPEPRWLHLENPNESSSATPTLHTLYLERLPAPE